MTTRLWNHETPALVPAGELRRTGSLRPVSMPVRVVSEDNFKRAEQALRFAVEQGHMEEGEL